MVKSVVRILAMGVALSTVSCAAVWGFEPLSAGDDDASVDGAAADASSSDGSSNDGATNDSGASEASSPGIDCESSGGECTCAPSTRGPNGAPCSAATLGVDSADVVCCADPSYPSSGSCICEWIGCTTSGANCICGPLNGTPGGSCADSTWTCCIQTGAPQCLCSPMSCLNGFTEFGHACGIADVKCAGAQRKVQSCN